MKQLGVLKHLILIIAVLAMAAPAAIAQTSDEESEIKNIEAELERNVPQIRPDQMVIPPVLSKERETVNLEGIHAKGDQHLAIIQKNYMPKTKRFSVTGGLTFFPSDVFFKTFGAQLRSSYHFNETWGIEGSAIFFNSSKSSELLDLEKKQDVTASNITTLKSYYGVSAYFNSMYGKYALNDRHVFPFEIYQTIGLGQIKTDHSTNGAVSVGLGQLLSLSRDSALRVDINMLFYQAENISLDKTSSSAFLITIAYTAFFPKAGKRW